jgi:hypothetical protein
MANEKKIFIFKYSPTLDTVCLESLFHLRLLFLLVSNDGRYSKQDLKNAREAIVISVTERERDRERGEKRKNNKTICVM